MHRFLSLLIVFLLIFTYSIAVAEYVTDGTDLEMEDFTLDLDQGIIYSRAEKALLQICLQIYPYAATTGDTSSINFVWCGSFDADAEIMKYQIPLMESQYAQQFEPYGITVESVVSNDPVDSTISGTPCVYFDTKLVLAHQSRIITMYQRQYHIGSTGYVITIGASNEALREEMDQLLSSSLAWK